MLYPRSIYGFGVLAGAFRRLTSPTAAGHLRTFRSLMTKTGTGCLVCSEPGCSFEASCHGDQPGRKSGRKI